MAPALRAQWDALVSRAWPVWGAALLVATVNVFLFAFDRPWTASDGLRNWGDWVLTAAGLMRRPDLLPPWLYSGSLLNLGVLLGGAAGALCAREFAIRVPARGELVKGAAGGVLMGVGATLAFGCNIGGFFSAVSALSLVGFAILKFTDLKDKGDWVFAAAGVGGLLGGTLFGIGMTLAGGCGAGSIWRAGEGQVKLWAAVACFALGASAARLALGGALGKLGIAVFLPAAVGWGGATAAKYVRMEDPSLEVILIEPNTKFVSCPFSNLVLSGVRSIGSLTFGYNALREQHGVRIIHDTATAIEPDARRVRLGRGFLTYDRLIVAPGVDFQTEQIEGLAAAGDSVLHAWKAGPQTVALAQQLKEMPDGGVLVMSIPPAAYRCPPGPYERACQVAWYLKTRKPRAKLLVVD